MPIPVSCPHCQTSLKAPDSAGGRQVKCPSCGTPFAVPRGDEAAALSSAPPPSAGRPRQAAPPEEYDDGYDEAPRRRDYRQRGPEQPGIGVQLGMGVASLSVGAAGLVIGMIPCIGFIPGLAAGGIGLVLGLVGLIVAMTQQGRGVAFPIAGSATSAIALLVTLFWYYWIVRSTTNAVNDLQQQAQNWGNQMKQAQQNMPRPPFGNPGAAGAVPQQGGQLQLNAGVAFVAGNLAVGDVKDKKLVNAPCKIYTVNMAAGRRYQIDLASNEFDAFLRLENPGGQEVAFNDDFMGLNSRIVYTCPQGQGGVYRISATSLGGRTGTFTLRVQEQ